MNKAPYIKLLFSLLMSAVIGACSDGKQNNVAPDDGNVANGEMLDLLQDPIQDPTETTGPITNPQEQTQCLSHQNGNQYCVDQSTRYFSALSADTKQIWGFVLPGENSSNAVVEVLAVDDNVVLIADKNSAQEHSNGAFENERYEASFFTPGGAFIDTRHLLQIPDRDSYVAICTTESLDDCTASLATHQFTKNGSWLYEHALPALDAISSTAIDAENYALLIGGFEEFWGTQHYANAGKSLGEFYEAAGDLLVVSDDISPNDVPEEWLEKYSNNIDKYELTHCPDGGLIVSYPRNPHPRLFQQCRYLDWEINGESSSLVAHRTSDLHYNNFTITRNESAIAVTGGFTLGFGGLFGANSFTTDYFLKRVSGRSTEVESLSYSSAYGSESPGYGMHGWGVQLADGRTGSYVNRGESYNTSQVSYKLRDTAFANSLVSVSAKRDRVLTGESIRLSDGSYVPANQEIEFDLIDPGGFAISSTETFQNVETPPFYTDAHATFSAEDGSLLQVTPYINRHSPLALVILTADVSERPLLTTYMDFRLE